MSDIKQAVKKSIYVYENADILNAKDIRVNLERVIKVLEHQLNNDWVPCSERLPGATGYYECTVDWYGASTEELLLAGGHEIPKRVINLLFKKSTNTFERQDDNTFKIIAWRLQPEPWDGKTKTQ